MARADGQHHQVRSLFPSFRIYADLLILSRLVIAVRSETQGHSIGLKGRERANEVRP